MRGMQPAPQDPTTTPAPTGETPDRNGLGTIVLLITAVAAGFVAVGTTIAGDPSTAQGSGITGAALVALIGLGKYGQAIVKIVAEARPVITALTESRELLPAPPPVTVNVHEAAASGTVGSGLARGGVLAGRSGGAGQPNTSGAPAATRNVASTIAPVSDDDIDVMGPEPAGNVPDDVADQSALALADGDVPDHRDPGPNDDIPDAPDRLGDGVELDVVPGGPDAAPIDDEPEARA